MKGIANSHSLRTSCIAVRAVERMVKKMKGTATGYTTPMRKLRISTGELELNMESAMMSPSLSTKDPLHRLKTDMAKNNSNTTTQ